MPDKRRHLVFGLWGIYLILLTGFMLYAGVFQLSNTLYHYSEIGVIGFDRIDYEELTAYMHVRFALFLLVPIVQLVIGAIGASCIVITPSGKKIRIMAYFLCLLVCCTIARGFAAGMVSGSMFRDIPRAALVFILAKQWECHQRWLTDSEDAKRRIFFPFIQEFRKIRRSEGSARTPEKETTKR